MTVNTATSGFTVVTNDYPGILAGNPVALSALTITTSGTSANGGIVVMTTSGANVGRFVYSAPPGFTGTDTFTYVISNGVAGTPAGSATGTVTMNVVGPVIWFVDDSAPAGGNGTWTGTNSKAFQTVTQAAAVDAANHRIYLASGTYANGISLNADEWVVGEGATGASFDAVMGTSYGTDTPGRPAVGGTKPAWTAAAGSNVVFLANNNTILGVAITGSTVTAVQGTNVTTGLIGNATTSDVTIASGSGTGGCFLLSGGSGAFNINATITSTVGRSVSISGRGTGVVTFSRAITDTGTGILLDNNDQSGVATITFTGGLNLSTGANAAFAATNGGTVNATQDNTTIVNTLTTTTGTALNVNGTTIGGSGLTFRSISSNGAANGIFLNNTGAGGLTVTGNAGTCTFATPTCSGGRIQSTAGADNTTNGIGVYLQNAQNVSLTQMRIDNHPNFAIRGHIVNNFTLQNVVIDGNNGTSSTADIDIVNGEDSVRIINLTGTALIDSSFIGGGYEQNLRIINDTGALNRLTVNNCSIGDLDGAGPGRGVDPTNGDDNITFATADGALTAMNGTFTNNILNNARGDVFQAANSDLSAPQAAMDVVFRNNTVSNNHPNIVIAGGGVTFNGTGGMTYDISCNKFRDSKGHGLNVFKSRPGNGQGPGGTWSGTIFNNRIGVTGVGDSGGLGNGLNVEAQGNGTHTTLIKNNQILNYNTAGIFVGVIDANTVAPTALTMNATVIGNTTSEPDPVNAFAGFHTNQGAVSPADATTTLNLKLGGAGGEQNNFVNGDPTNGNDVALQRSAGAIGTFNLTQGASGVSTPVTTVVQNNNVSPITLFADAGITVVAAVPGLPAATDQTCVPPPLLFAPGGVAAVPKATLPKDTLLNQAALATAVATVDARRETTGDVIVVA